MPMGRDQFAIEHEEGLAYFMEPTYRPRFRDSLTSPKRREKLIASLDHFKHLDYRWAYDATRMRPREIRDYLRKCGATDRCYVLSSDSDYLQMDERFRWILGTEANLSQALEDLAEGDFGTFISCIPGRLAFFEGEDLGQRFILQRPAA
jgi:hypothetical protein